jgi:tetratricopeptide (TPR) repeat protein
VHLLAAQTARRRGAYDEAERHLAACTQLEPVSQATALERLLLGAQQGDLDDVEGLLKGRTDAKDPEAALVLEALAKGYGSRFWYKDALAFLNLLLQRRPQHAQALLLRGRVAEALARRGEAEGDQQALRDYEQVVALAPSFEARLGLAGAFYRLGRPWDALNQYEQLEAEQAGQPEVLLGLARCRFRLHDVDQARRLLDQLLAQHPGHTAAVLERGRLALRAGELAAAEKWLTQAVAAAPACEAEPLRLLRECLLAAHKEDAARRCAERLRQNEADMLRVDRLMLQANRDPRDVALRYQIASELLRLGREEDGVAALFLVLEQDPQHGPAHAALADYLERTGQPGRAARHRRAGLPRAAARPSAR